MKDANGTSIRRQVRTVLQTLDRDSGWELSAAAKALATRGRNVLPVLLTEYVKAVRIGALDRGFVIAGLLKDDALVPILSFRPLWESFLRTYKRWKTRAKRRALPSRQSDPATNEDLRDMLRQIAQALGQVRLSFRQGEVLQRFIYKEDTFLATQDNFLWSEDVRDTEGTGLLGDLLDTLFVWRRDLAEAYVVERLRQSLPAPLRTQLIRAVGWWYVSDAVSLLEQYLRVPVYDPRCEVLTIETLGTVQEALSIPARLVRARRIPEWVFEPAAVVRGGYYETPQYFTGLSPWRAGLYALCRLGHPGAVKLVLSKLRETLGPERPGGMGEFPTDLLTILADARLQTPPVRRLFSYLVTRSSRSIAAGGPLLVIPSDFAHAMVVCGRKVFPNRAAAAALRRLLAARKRHVVRHKRDRADLMLRNLLAASLLLSPHPRRSAAWRVFREYSRFLRRAPNVIDLLADCAGTLYLALDRPGTIEPLLQPFARAKDQSAIRLLERYGGRPRLPEYKIDRFLAEGATKVAWLAHLNIPGAPRRSVVLKLFREPNLARMLRQFGYTRRRLLESEISSSGSTFLSVPMLRLDELGRPCLVEEYFPKGTLDQAVKTWPHAGRLRLLVSTVSDICSGLRDLHKQQRVHCDLKLDNIGIRDDGHAVVIDLGTSIDVSGRPQPYLVNPGSPRTRAPELFGRGVSPTPRSDIWSLGCIIFALVTGGNRYPYFDVGDDLGLWLQRSVREQALSAQFKQPGAQVELDHLIDTTLRSAHMEVLSPILYACLRIDPSERAGECEAIHAMLSATTVAAHGQGVSCADAESQHHPMHKA